MPSIGSEFALHLGARAADVLLVLRDIGEMREIGKSAHDLDRCVAREAVEGRFQFRSRGVVVITAELDRDLTNALYSREYSLTLLLADDIAQKAAEQTNVLA